VNIQYFEPLSRGFARMKKALFNPFDLKKWFVVGFTAFLSGLTDCGGHGSSGKRSSNVDWEDVLYFPDRAWEWLAENPVWAVVIAFAVALGLVLFVLCTWWSARGKFMFLDNVVHDRSQVRAPWNEFKTEGNSLFFWSLAIGIVIVVIAIGYLAQCFITLRALYEVGDGVTSLIMPVILMVLGFLGIMLVFGFMDLLLYDFVVPIMYRDRITTLKAVQKFLPLLLTHPFQFLGFGFFTLFIFMVVLIGILVAGFATCCIGFVFLAIPYINSVVLLPIFYTMRAFSVEFLEQFGGDYHIFPKDVSTPAGAEPTAA
jgi:hypothetical protein